MAASEVAKKKEGGSFMLNQRRSAATIYFSALNNHDHHFLEEDEKENNNYQREYREVWIKIIHWQCDIYSCLPTIPSCLLACYDYDGRGITLSSIYWNLCVDNYSPGFKSSILSGFQFPMPLKFGSTEA